jgi:hypothetical protein
MIPVLALVSGRERPEKELTEVDVRHVLARQINRAVLAGTAVAVAATQQPRIEDLARDQEQADAATHHLYPLDTLKGNSRAEARGGQVGGGVATP